MYLLRLPEKPLETSGIFRTVRTLVCTAMKFDWDPDKREANLEKHGVDFVDAVEIFVVPHVVLDSPRKEEDRHVAIRPLPSEVVPHQWSGPLTTVAFHRRGSVIRLISARRARIDEREQYRRTITGGD